MPKYLIVEAENDEILNEIIEAIRFKTSNIAICNRPPPIWAEERRKYEKDSSNNSSENDITHIKTENLRKNREMEIEEAADLKKINGDNALSSLFEGLSNGLFDSSSLGTVLANAMSPDEETTIGESTIRGYKRKTRMAQESSLNARRRQSENHLVCGKCSSKMTLRASYGRTRLREHVIRHMDIATAQCSHCDYKGPLREHVRRHYFLKHKGIPPAVVDLEPEPGFDKRFEEYWKECFPNTEQMQPRMSSQRVRVLEDSLEDHEEEENVDSTEEKMTNSGVGISVNEALLNTLNQAFTKK